MRPSVMYMVGVIGVRMGGELRQDTLPLVDALRKRGSTLVEKNL